jgi:SAM-dependent methyltransferase
VVAGEGHQRREIGREISGGARNECLVGSRLWPAIERAVRYARAAYIDLRLFLTGKTDYDLPPLRLRFVGAGDFRAVGDHLLNLTITRGGLARDSRILDIGCGSGRLAIPLTRYLTAGQYEGFDVVAPAIRWCRRRISSAHPNFCFTHVRLRNTDYSFLGRSASRFTFPYDDSTFDCVAAYSVFTHLQFDEIRNYLKESHRVLAPRGRLAATFFLLNEESESESARQFPHGDGPIRLASRSNPAFAVAVNERRLQELLREVGFRSVIIEPGGWYGLQKRPEFQDLIVCEK